MNSNNLKDSVLTDLVTKKSEIELIISSAESDLFNIKNKICNEIVRTEAYEYLNVNYEKLESNILKAINPL